MTWPLTSSMLGRVRASWFGMVVFLVGCHQTQPISGSAVASTVGPTATSSATRAGPSSGTPPPAATASARLPEPAPSGFPSAAPGPSHVPTTTADALLDEGALLDEAGRPLPQTDERPTTSSPAFRRRAELLFEAIRDDRPELARQVFFPVTAYREVKAIARPERDWQFRLWRAFERDVHQYHRELGSQAASATLVELKVPTERARMMKPGSEGNRLGYWRVLRSELTVRDVRGREHRLEVTSLISWRGEWYVVHLHGFK